MKKKARIMRSLVIAVLFAAWCGDAWAMRPGSTAGGSVPQIVDVPVPVATPRPVPKADPFDFLLSSAAPQPAMPPSPRPVQPMYGQQHFGAPPSLRPAAQEPPPLFTDAPPAPLSRAAQLLKAPRTPEGIAELQGLARQGMLSADEASQAARAGAIRAADVDALAQRGLLRRVEQLPVEPPPLFGRAEQVVQEVAGLPSGVGALAREEVLPAGVQQLRQIQDELAQAQRFIADPQVPDYMKAAARQRVTEIQQRIAPIDPQQQLAQAMQRLGLPTDRAQNLVAQITGGAAAPPSWAQLQSADDVMAAMTDLRSKMDGMRNLTPQQKQQMQDRALDLMGNMAEDMRKYAGLQGFDQDRLKNMTLGDMYGALPPNVKNFIKSKLRGRLVKIGLGVGVPVVMAALGLGVGGGEVAEEVIEEVSGD